MRRQLLLKLIMLVMLVMLVVLAVVALLSRMEPLRLRRRHAREGEERIDTVRLANSGAFLGEMAGESIQSTSGEVLSTPVTGAIKGQRWGRADG